MSEPQLPWGMKAMHYTSTESPHGHCTQGEARFARLQVTTFLASATRSEIRHAQRRDLIEVAKRLKIDLARSLADTDRYLKEMEDFMKKPKKKGGRKSC